MARNIVELNIDGTSYTNRPFGTCGTAAGTSAKVVTCSEFVLVQYATILVKFTYTNSASSPTLNVNGTGAKSIRWNGSTSIGDKIKAGDVYEFIYDGTYWLCLGGIDTNDVVAQIPTTSDDAFPLLMTYNPSQTNAITNGARFNPGLTYNPSTKTLGLDVLNCTTFESTDNSNVIDIFANRQLPTIFRFGIPTAVENIAPSTSINLTYSGPGMTWSEAMSHYFSIGPKIVNDTTTDGFLISTDKPLHIESQGVAFGSNVIPNQDEAYNLGNSTNKWNEVHAESFKGTADSARLTPYGVCSIASSTADKTVTTSVPFVLEAGARVSVKFNNTNTASNMTLNVNSTGAKNVYFNSSPVGTYVILANNVYEFIYDGTKWILQPGVHNTTGSSSSISKLYLIGALTQSSSGVRTYSNSNVYTQGGSIYTGGGFYDVSTTTGASVYKAVVPKDYTEAGYSQTIGGTHALNKTLSSEFDVPSPQYGGLVCEMNLTAGSETQILLTPQINSTIYSTTLDISLQTTTPSYRYVRVLLTVPVTVGNNGVYPTTFRYNVRIKHNYGSYKSIYQSYSLAVNGAQTIEKLSIIYDLKKDTILNDTTNGTTSWI